MEEFADKGGVLKTDQMNESNDYSDVNSSSEGDEQARDEAGLNELIRQMESAGELIEQMMTNEEESAKNENNGVKREANQDEEERLMADLRAVTRDPDRNDDERR